MALNNELFHRELYIEHFEEGAFHYATRVAWFTDEEVGWQDWERLEIAIEAHLDGLVVGGESALKVCLELLPNAEYDQLFMIVLLLCRLRSTQGLGLLWPAFDFFDEEKQKAVSDAFLWECPDEWAPHIANVFANGKPELCPILAPCLAQKQISVGEAYLQAMSKVDIKQQVRMLEILPTLPDAKNFRLHLEEYVNHPNHSVAAAAIVAALRLGLRSVLERCRAEPNLFPLQLVIAGERDDVRRVLAVAQRGDANADTLFALGLSGRLDAVPVLLPYLQHEDYGAAAAQALHFITGAPLFETIQVSEPITEDELFEHELEGFQRGDLPPVFAGDEVNRLSQDPAQWQTWLTEHSAHFQRGQLYRLGELLSPAIMVQQLIDNQTPSPIRYWIYLALILRYGLPLTFDPQARVATQKRSLHLIYQWLTDSGASHS